MCLSTVKEKFKTETDIHTWKAVLLNEKTGEWRGIFQMNDKVFPLNEVVTNKERKNVVVNGWNCTLVHGGFFHSSVNMKIPYLIKTDPGLQYGKREYENSGFRTEVVECVIPKGTECYTDGYGNYASRKIKVIKQ